MKTFLICAAIAVTMYSCDDAGGSETSSKPGETKETTKTKSQINLSVLLDLSDRIDTKTNPGKPEHFEKDLEIIRYLDQYFAKEMEKNGAFMSKGKFRVLFSPKPNDPNINVLAQKMNVDLSKMDVKQKKQVHDNIEKDFTNAAQQIYATTIQTNKWIGSDVWRFFKNDVKDYCIEQDPAYRNVLVIITDGYLYHPDSKDKVNNRYAYILPSLFEQYKLRKNQNWETEMEKQDFGLIAKRDDLENLEVLVLEVNPSANHKNDEDIIKKVLSKWFTEMNVKRFAIHNSDLPEYTKKRIDDFLSKP